MQYLIWASVLTRLRFLLFPLNNAHNLKLVREKDNIVVHQFEISLDGML